MKVNRNCPICSSGNLSYSCDHLDFSEIEIFHCPDCKHWSCHPEPAKIWLESYYCGVYGRESREPFAEEYVLTMKKRAAAQVDFMQRHLSPAGNDSVSLSGKRVLDLGCGVGALVAELEAQSAYAVGYDSDPIAIAVGKSTLQANVHTGHPNRPADNQPQYDLLCLSHVVEHLPSVKESLSEMLRFLKPGGYVFIEVPNSFGQMFHGEIDTLSHLHFFTKQSLVTCLGLIGLEDVNCLSCGPPRERILTLWRKSSHNISTRGWVPGSIARLKGLLSQLKQRWVKVEPVTLFDGFYETYYGSDETGGMWLRCLARKPVAA